MGKLGEKSESDLMRQYVEAGYGSGEGPDDEHEVEVVDHADAK